MILYFILGILFIEIAIPVVESLVTLILAWIEVIKGKCSLEISKINAEVQKLDVDDTPKHAIGFAIPTETYEEEEDDDE